MCNSATASFAALNPGLLLTAGGSGFEAVGHLRQGEQQKAMYDFQGRQLQADAAAAVGQAEVNAGTIRKAGRLQRGTARAQLAKAGVQVDAGSAGGLQDYITEQSELDVISELMTGRRTAARMESQAQMSFTAGRLARKNAQWAAAGSLLSGGADAARMGSWGKR